MGRDPNASIQRQVEDMGAGMLKSRIERISSNLRRLADAADRAAAEVDDVLDGKRASYGDLASTVQHEMLWGLANLGLDSLISAARDADEAKAVQRAREKIAQAIEAYATEHDDGGREFTGMETAVGIARQYGEG